VNVGGVVMNPKPQTPNPEPAFMTHRERVLSTFRFEPTDRPAYDLMEQQVWPELLAL
jgi:hypothetical protein